VYTGKGTATGSGSFTVQDDTSTFLLAASTTKGELTSTAVTITGTDTVAVKAASSLELQATGAFRLYTSGTGSGTISTGGNSGYLDIHTGSATGSAAAGALSLVVGESTSGSGSHVTLSAGKTTAASQTGGNVLISAGEGTAASGFIQLSGLLALQSLRSSILAVTNSVSTVSLTYSTVQLQLSGTSVDLLAVDTSGAVEGQLLTLVVVSGSNKVQINAPLTPAGSDEICLQQLSPIPPGSVTLMYSIPSISGVAKPHWIVLLGSNLAYGVC